MASDDTDVSDANERTGYEELAARADELGGNTSPWGDSPFQRYHAWPATRDLLPDETERALVAGCGRGDHLDAFQERAERVVGVDASERALAAARERHPALCRADLSAPLPFGDGAFDLVCSHLVFGHLRAWRPALREFARVLADDGTLVLTTVHPEYLRATAAAAGGSVDAHERVSVTREWAGAEVTVHYRPTGEALQAVLDAGFRLERVVEPAPRPAYEREAPERYRAAMSRPEVLSVRATVAD